MHFCKNRASVSTFVSSMLCSASGNKRTPKFFVLNLTVEVLNSAPSLAASYTVKYSKHDFQKNFNTLLKAQRSSTYNQDWETSEDLLEQAVKYNTLDVYESKWHINCYNVI